MTHRWGLLGLIVLSLLLGAAPARAGEPQVTFGAERLTLSGTPGSALRFPVELRAGPQGARSVSLAVEALVNQERPEAVILGDSISFLPASLDMAPGGQRRVWGTISALPATPGLYRGELVASSDVTPTVQSAIPVELTVHFAGVRVSAAGDRLAIRGRSGDLAQVVWLEAVDGPAAGVTLAADQLTRADGASAILPDQLSMSPATLSLSRDELALVTIKVSEQAQPGSYRGQVRFRQADQPLNQARPYSLTVEVLPTPQLKLPQGEAVSAQLVHCRVGLDCLLADWLLPADYRQPGLLVPVENTAASQVIVGAIQPAIARIGPVNLTGAAELLKPESLPITLETRSARDIRLNLPGSEATLAPGRYKGNVTLYLSDAQGRSEAGDKQVVAVDVTVRRGPLLALLLILAGIVAGRLAQRSSGEQTRLLGAYYRVKGTMRAYEKEMDAADWRRLEVDALALRQRIYARDLDKLQEAIGALGRRPQRLVTLKQALPAIQQAWHEQGLGDADRRLLEQALERLRTEIHADEQVDAAAEAQAIAARAGSLQRLSALSDQVHEANLEDAERSNLLAKVEAARQALARGDDGAAAQHYQHVQRALALLPEVRRLEEEAESELSGQPERLELIKLELGMARHAVFDADFAQAERWLERARLTVTAWQTAVPKAMIEKGMPMGEREIAIRPVVSRLGAALEQVMGHLAGWQPTPLLGGWGGVVVTPAAWRGVGLAEWLAVRWQGFVSAVGAEIGLWVGTPLVWAITMVVTALIGFRILYVTQGTTFGADPLNDYLTMVLWGITSDVAGATLSQLAGLRKAG